MLRIKSQPCLVTGLVSALYVLQYLVNHAFGIVSIEVRGRENQVRVCRFDSDALPAGDADRSNR